MKRSERLLDLMHLLGGRRRVPLGEITRRFDISERTASRDLAHLGYRMAPVVREEGGYRLMEGARLQPQTLTRTERRLLTALLDTPALARLPSLAVQLRCLADKLAPEGVSSIREQQLRLVEVERSGPIVARVARRLESAIDARTTVRIDYASLSSAIRRWRAVDPLAIFHRAHAWYLVARCHESGQPRIFRLDRVLDVESEDRHFDTPPDFALDSFLAGSWEVFRGEETYDVVIRFSPTLAPLVLHGYHHPGEQVEALPDGGAEYRVTLSHLEEIARWVVGFGGEAVAVEPPALMARVLEICQRTSRMHTTGAHTVGEKKSKGTVRK